MTADWQLWNIVMKNKCYPLLQQHKTRREIKPKPIQSESETKTTQNKTRLAMHWYNYGQYRMCGNGLETRNQSQIISRFLYNKSTTSTSNYI